MLKRLSLLAAVGTVFAFVLYAAADKPDPAAKQLPIPEMKFNDVKEIAPGVFFRYSSISANDPKIKFGGSNHTWIVFKDYVVVMMVSQGGTGSGTSGPAIRKIWEALYGIDGTRVDTSAAALPGARPPAGLPVFADDGAILPPTGKSGEKAREPRRSRG